MSIARLMQMGAAGGGAALIPPEQILIYGNSGPKVYDGTTYGNVTSTYIPSLSPALATAAGYEQVWVTDNNRYIGFGSWARSPNSKGGACDRSTTPWTFYLSYTGLSLPGTGNDFVQWAVPNSSGQYVAATSGTSTDEGVFSLTSPSTEYTGQPALFTAGWQAGSCSAFSRGSYLWVIEGSTLYRFTFTASVLSGGLSYNLASAFSNVSIDDTGKFKANLNDVAAYVSGNGYINIVDLSVSPGSSSITAQKYLGSATTSGACTISPDGKYVVADSNGNVILYDITANSLTTLSKDPSTAGAYTDFDFFADSNYFVATSTSSNASAVYSISSGGFIERLGGGSNFGGYNIRALYPIV
jgi:hypothetical protein